MGGCGAQDEAGRVTSNSQPKVSIGMPVYNGAEWIRATIDSVLAQTYRDLELVISDNASSDATEQICREYQQRDPRVRYFRNPSNVGVSNNFNKAFERSRGQFFKWTSCSDLIDPQFIARCMAVIEARPEVVLVFPRTRLFQGTVANGTDYEERLQQLDVRDPVARFEHYTKVARLNNIMHGLIRADALRPTPLYRKFIAADYNMIAELLLYGPAVHLPEVLHFRRMEKETFTGTLSPGEMRILYDPQRPSQIRFQIWRRMRDYFGVVMRAPLPWVHKLRLLKFVLRQTAWTRAYLQKDFNESLAFSLRRRS
jgi:glycosyltransferase involved in cell wall biosynthesis